MLEMLIKCRAILAISFLNIKKYYKKKKKRKKKTINVLNVSQIKNQKKGGYPRKSKKLIFDSNNYYYYLRINDNANYSNCPSPYVDNKLSISTPIWTPTNTLKTWLVATFKDLPTQSVYFTLTSLYGWHIIPNPLLLTKPDFSLLIKCWFQTNNSYWHNGVWHFTARATPLWKKKIGHFYLSYKKTTRSKNSTSVNINSLSPTNLFILHDQTPHLKPKSAHVTSLRLLTYHLRRVTVPSTLTPFSLIRQLRKVRRKKRRWLEHTENIRFKTFQTSFWHLKSTPKKPLISKLAKRLNILNIFRRLVVHSSILNERNYTNYRGLSSGSLRGHKITKKTPWLKRSERPTKRNLQNLHLFWKTVSVKDSYKGADFNTPLFRIFRQTLPMLPSVRNLNPGSHNRYFDQTVYSTKGQSINSLRWSYISASRIFSKPNTLKYRGLLPSYWMQTYCVYDHATTPYDSKLKLTYLPQDDVAPILNTLKTSGWTRRNLRLTLGIRRKRFMANKMRHVMRYQYKALVKRRNRLVPQFLTHTKDLISNPELQLRFVQKLFSLKPLRIQKNVVSRRVGRRQPKIFRPLPTLFYKRIQAVISSQKKLYLKSTDNDRNFISNFTNVVKNKTTIPSTPFFDNITDAQYNIVTPNTLKTTNLIYRNKLTKIKHTLIPGLSVNSPDEALVHYNIVSKLIGRSRRIVLKFARKTRTRLLSTLSVNSIGALRPGFKTTPLTLLRSFKIYRIKIQRKWVRFKKRITPKQLYGLKVLKVSSLTSLSFKNFYTKSAVSLKFNFRSNFNFLTSLTVVGKQLRSPNTLKLPTDPTIFKFFDKYWFLKPTKSPSFTHAPFFLIQFLSLLYLIPNVRKLERVKYIYYEPFEFVDYKRIKKATFNRLLSIRRRAGRSLYKYNRKFFKRLDTSKKSFLHSPYTASDYQSEVFTQTKSTWWNSLRLFVPDIHLRYQQSYYSRKEGSDHLLRRFIKKTRYKPGYQRIWREERESIKEYLKLTHRYQYRLTGKLALLHYPVQNTYPFRRETLLHLSLGQGLMVCSFAMDDVTAANLLQNNLVYLNGSVATNEFVQLFMGDFIQLLISIRFYLIYRWIKSGTLKRYNKWLSLYYKTYRIRRQMFKDFTFRVLPDRVMTLKYTWYDIPRYMEVDYFTLSVFLLSNDPYRDLTHAYPTQLYNICIINMYNWKYLN